MTDRFHLTLPADEGYRMLAPDIAVRYAELAGATKADGAALASALAEAFGRLADAADTDAAIGLVFSVEPDGLEVALTCGERTERVRQPMAQAR